MGDLAHTISEMETHRLAKCEAVVERHLASFIEVGSALLEIRNGRLYRSEYETFEAYCKERWGMSRPRAYQLVAATEAVGNLSTIVDKPTSEAQARPLTRLETPDLQREAWQEAVDTAPGRITAAHVERTVRQVEARYQPEASEDTPEKTPRSMGHKTALIKIAEIVADLHERTSQPATLWSSSHIKRYVDALVDILSNTSHD